MSAKKFISRNIITIVMVPVIIGAHYGWYKLQDMESLVSPEEKNNLPFMKMLKNTSIGSKE